MTWTQTASGGRVDILNPQPGQIAIRDVAHHLSRINRFTGAIRFEHYSVAQHTVMCALTAELLGLSAHARMWCLLHDAHEMCVNDISSPLKQAIRQWHGGDALENIEDGLDLAIWRDLLGDGVAFPTKWDRDAVKQVDLWMLGQEAKRVLKGGPRKDWGFIPPKLDVDPKHLEWKPWRPNEAKQEFLVTFRRLRRFLKQNAEY